MNESRVSLTNISHNMHRLAMFMANKRISYTAYTDSSYDPLQVHLLRYNKEICKGLVGRLRNIVVE